jgi:TrmH family RNA methyltransferase
MKAGGWSLERVLALRLRAEREREGLFFVEGVRFLVTAMDAGMNVAALVVAPDLLASPVALRAVRRLRASGVPLLEVSPADFTRLSLLSEPQGVGAVLRERWSSVAALAHPRRDALWVALEHLRSPGNLGSLLRTCDAVGATGVVFTGDDVDPYDPSAVRATMGSLFRQRLLRATPEEIARVNRYGEYIVVGATPEAARDFRTLSYRRPALLVLGSERSGLSEAQRALCDELVRIPMCGSCDSLNLAVAASVLLYEAFGQRHPARCR